MNRSMRAAPVERDPVPSFESLALCGAPIRAVDGALAANPRLALVGDDEGILVYDDRPSRSPTARLVSRRIRRLFSSWPPEMDDPVEHPFEGGGGDMGRLVAFHDGTFGVQRGDWVFASGDEPGVRIQREGPHFPDPASDAVYVIRREAECTRVLRHTNKNARGHVQVCGVLPASPGVTGCVDGRGKLVAIPSSKSRSVRVFVVSEAGVVEGDKLAVGKANYRLLPRRGGASLVVQSSPPVVHTIDGEGSSVGSPWSPPDVGQPAWFIAAAPWRDGCVVASLRGNGGVGLSVMDGSQSTHCEELLSPVHVVSTDLVASSDGTSVVLAFGRDDGLYFARYACGPGDPAAAFVPTAGYSGRTVEEPTIAADSFGARTPLELGSERVRS